MIDESLPPLGELVEGFADYFEPQVDEGVQWSVESVGVDLPVEMSFDDNGTVRASTPTQFTETTIMPVFHQLRLRVEAQYEDG